MAITPAGAPAWTRTASHTQYGGHPNKENYLSQGVIDAETDVGAEHIARLAADLEAMARTAPFATITFLCNDSSPGAPTIESVFMMTAIQSVPYAGDSPPTGLPEATRSGTGHVVFTFADEYTDPYGVTAPFIPTHALANVHGSTAADATVDVSGQTVTVRVFNNAGSAIADKRVTLTVW